MKDIENNSGNVFDAITVVESSNLNIITSNSISLFGNAGQILIRASPTTVNYAMTLPNSIGTAGQILSTDGAGNAYWVTAGGGGGGTGTVTSVGLTVPSILNVSGSPITSSGTLAITTATAPSGTGAIVLANKPSIVKATVTSVFEDGAFGEEYVGVNALSSNVLNTGFSNDHYFGINRDSGYHIKISTRNEGTDLFNNITCGENILNFFKSGTFESVRFTQNIPANYFEFGTDTSTVQSTTRLICETVSFKNTFSDATKPSVLITNRSAGLSNLSKVTAGSTGQILTVQGDGSLAFSTPASGGSVTSVALTVPSILSVSGSPITSSGTLAITTATTPTGSGAIVLQSQPTISKPTITSVLTSTLDGDFYVGVNALDSSIPDGDSNTMLFGINTTDPGNYLKISTLNSSGNKSTTFSTGSTSFEMGYTNATNTSFINNQISSSVIQLSQTISTTKIRLIADSVVLPTGVSDATKPSVLITNRSSGESVIQKVTAGSTGQILTVQGNGSLAFSAPSGGSVTSVALTVPAILSVSGSPITTSGTLAITTAATPTGSGAIVLQSQPSIVNPTITSFNSGGTYLGINALDSTIPSGSAYEHRFGINTTDTRNYLSIKSDISASFKSSSISNGSMTAEFSNNLTANTREILIANDTASIKVSRDNATTVGSISILSENLFLDSDLSDATKPSVLITNQVSSLAKIAKVTAGSTSQALTVQGDGSLAFSAPSYTTQSTTLKTKNTIYQNASTKPLMVFMNVNTAVAAETFTIKCDTNSTPTTIISEAVYYVNDYPVTFLVLPGYYYQITSSNSGTIKTWCEWN